jgi:site-specific DNA-methyltransferase (adenine-specific)
MSIELLNGDAYELIKTLPDRSVDLVVTDPPYLIESTETGSKSRLAKSIQKMNNQLAEGVLTTGVNNTILEELVRVMKKINIYIWCNHKQLPQYLDYFVTRLGCRFDILIWNKTNATPLFNNKYLTDKEYCLYFRRGGAL